ncbi:extracellular solute-binding protein [Verticiella sediminum]|uniref:Extracellular solute-binding protein n=1 Tax=Verticiella sediminum TaxID=1247510 RepID=A0A556A7A2_9BURK|nr:extracellular solute-binding protein [Verticiella sediminum]TSH88763.1 extracellular solute-binding protein [Verticiella sediminum]
MFRPRILASAAVVAGTFCAGLAQAAEPVTIYSSRIERLIKPILDKYTEETGVEVRLLNDNGSALMERLAAEGEATQADMLITVDVGNLWRAADRGLIEAAPSEILAANVPETMRDPQGRWYGLSRRERTLFFDPRKVKPEQLSTYEDLADPKWKGQLCLRTGKQTYTQSLVAMLIHQHGAQKAEEIVRGWVDNLATEVFTNDTSLLEAVAAGQCTVGIANTYYYGRLIAAKSDFKEQVHLFWANQGKDEGGVHVNLSGAGVVTHAKNPQGALKLMEWLSSDAAQNGYTHGTYESPVNPAVAPDAIVKAWGTYEANPINASDIGKLQPEAILLLDRAGYR